MDDQQQAAIAAEDAADDSTLSLEARRRKEDRLKKRAYRAKEKQQKQAAIEAKKAEQFDDIQQYWTANLAKLTDEQRIGMEAREDYVLDLMLCMEYTLEETGTTQADLDDLVSEVKSDVAKFGQCCGAILNIPRIWSEENAELRKCIDARSEPFFPGEQLVGRMNATSVLITYGMFVAVTERIYQDFSERFIKRTPVPQYSEIVKCSVCGRERYFGKEEANDYRKRGRKFLCQQCESAEQKSRKEATIIKPEIRIGRETVVDGRGKAHPDAFDPLRYLWKKE